MRRPVALLLINIFIRVFARLSQHVSIASESLFHWGFKVIHSSQFIVAPRAVTPATWSSYLRGVGGAGLESELADHQEKAMTGEKS
jgi:hypothetical protein